PSLGGLLKFFALTYALTWTLFISVAAAAIPVRSPLGGLLVFVLQVTALSVAMAWLYARTRGSLLLVMLLHSAVNNAKDIVPSSVAGATNTFSLNASLVAWLTVTLLWICAAWFLARMPSRDLPELVRT